MDTETVSFQGLEIPVTVYRRKVLGTDRFHTRYDVQEPERLLSDRELIDAVRSQLLENPPETTSEERGTAVLDRARTLLRRRLLYRDAAEMLGPLKRVAERLGRRLGINRPSQDLPPEGDRLEELTYYVGREVLGEGPLTIPLRDPRLGSIEVTDLGAQVTVRPHR